MKIRNLAATIALMLPVSLFGATIIDGTTLGYYNSGLGDLATDSVLGAQTDTVTGFKLFPALNVTAGDPLIPPIATEPNLAGADAGTVAAFGNFLTNPAALGAPWTGLQAIPSTWTVNDETAIVYEINAGSGYGNVTLDLGVDNGIFVWLDGVYLFGALSPGSSNINEYDVNIGSISGGTHYLQILREDHGGGTGFDILMEGDALTSEVPEPASLFLLGAGCVGLLIGRKRRRNA